MWHPFLSLRRFVGILLILIMGSGCMLYALLPATSKEPVALYLTWQHDPTSTMTIQWITLREQDSSYLEYTAASNNGWHNGTGISQLMPGDSRYRLHRLELIGLQPDIDYHFRIGQSTKIHTFRTMPATLERPIRFVVGGDIYHNGIEFVRETNTQAAKQSPQFALMGGDLAYAADKFAFFSEGWQSWIDRMLASIDIRPAKRIRWIEWLAAWKDTMVTPEGRLIPMIPALGNHDVNGGFGKSAADAQSFHALFSFPGPQGFQAIDFGRYMSLMVLDTGHTNPIGGYQTNWLFETLRQREDYPYKFALYHVPAYPSVRKAKNKTSSEVRNFWVPIFERFGLTAAFENHEHAYKRSHPILNGKVDPKGILYLGDGAWGVEEPREPASPEERWYIAQSASKRHFICVTLSKNECHFSAIDSYGEQFDELRTGN